MQGCSIEADGRTTALAAYLARLTCLARFTSKQGLGVASGLHALFSRFGADAITLHFHQVSTWYTCGCIWLEGVLACHLLCCPVGLDYRTACAAVTWAFSILNAKVEDSSVQQSHRQGVHIAGGWCLEHGCTWADGTPTGGHGALLQQPDRVPAPLSDTVPPGWAGCSRLIVAVHRAGSTAGGHTIPGGTFSNCGI